MARGGCRGLQAQWDCRMVPSMSVNHDDHLPHIHDSITHNSVPVGDIDTSTVHPWMCLLFATLLEHAQAFKWMKQIKCNRLICVLSTMAVSCLNHPLGRISINWDAGGVYRWRGTRVLTNHNSIKQRPLLPSPSPDTTAVCATAICLYMPSWCHLIKANITPPF